LAKLLTSLFRRPLLNMKLITTSYSTHDLTSYHTWQKRFTPIHRLRCLLASGVLPHQNRCSLDFNHRFDRKAHSRQSGNVLFPIEQQPFRMAPKVSSPPRFLHARLTQRLTCLDEYCLRRAPSFYDEFVRCIPSLFAYPLDWESPLPNRTSSLRASVTYCHHTLTCLDVRFISPSFDCHSPIPLIVCHPFISTIGFDALFEKLGHDVMTTTSPRLLDDPCLSTEC